MRPATSVLIPSFRRPAALVRCLESLKRQSLLPDEAVVVWQADDSATRDAAQSFTCKAPFSVVVAHSPLKGITRSENLALECSRGEVVLLIDDDATAPKDWVERHLSHFKDGTVGAVGGAADNYTPENVLFPRHEPRQVGRITWYGRFLGGMYDHPTHWRHRDKIEVDHLVGYNMALRRSAFEGFEERLKPYWQNFETDLCFQVRERGYRVLFDFGNVVNHYPANVDNGPGRPGYVEVRIYNAAYNWAFVMSKHSPWYLRFPRFVYMLFVGSRASPGVLGALVNVFGGSSLSKEVAVLPGALSSYRLGWSAGVTARAERLVKRETSKATI